jgi:hypothetical protein
LSSHTLTYAAGVIRRHRWRIGSCWRKLNPGRQALLVLAYPRKGETFAELAAGFGIGTATAWRYVTETVALLAARRRTPTVHMPSCGLLGNAPMPSSRPGASCANSAAAHGGPGNWPRPSTSFRPARSKDEKGSIYP